MISSLRISFATALLVVISATIARAQEVDTASVDELIRLLRSRTWDVRVAAALELPQRGADGARAVPALREMAAHDRNQFARSKAIQSLGYMRHAACSALPTLIPLVHHRDPDLRASAVGALGDIGLGCGDRAQDSVTLAIAARALKDPISYVRFFALLAIDEFDHPSLLVSALRSRDDTIAATAAKLLALHEPTDTVVSGLFAALGDRRRRVRIEAAHSLGSFGAPVRAALVEAAADSASSRASGARAALRYLEYSIASPVAGHCYRLEMTHWVPEIDVGGDSIFSSPPRLIRFSTVKFDAPSLYPMSFRVEPLAGRYTVHGPGYWGYSGDSLHVTWSTGFSGLGMRLHITRDTLAGTASTFWDFGRAEQTADVRGIPIECGDLPRRRAAAHVRQ